VAGVQDGVEGVAVSAGSLTLRQLICLIARARVMLVNDSGPMHMAAAARVPLVAIFGPTDHVRWMPRAATAQLVMADDTRPGALDGEAGESDVHRIPYGWVVEAGRRALAQAGRQ
ncbi:MAG: glycosyltransferase family 9 protein, partial [Candidatus Poribacteria bacterium]